jgi:hypothetical protein
MKAIDFAAELLRTVAESGDYDIEVVFEQDGDVYNSPDFDVVSGKLVISL